MTQLPTVQQIKTTPPGPIDLDEYGLNPQLPEVLDSTMMSDFVTCPSMFYLRHVLGLKPRGYVESQALKWGTAWHQMQFAFHENESLDDALMVWDALPEDWGEDDPKNRNKHRLRNLFLAYLQEYLELDRRLWEVLRREQYFDVWCPEDEPSCPLGGCGLRWSGRIDQIRQERETQNTYIWDYKTTSWLRGSYFDEQKHGFQIPGYVWAGLHILPTSIKGAYVDLQHTTKTKEKPIRKPLPYTHTWIIEWRENVKQYISDIQTLWKHHSHNPSVWGKNWEECHKYSGCLFWPVHSTMDVKNSRLRMLSNDYIEDRWDPAELVEGA